MAGLRRGFSTGAYAAATLLAAWRCLCAGRNGKRISLLFPDGRIRRINMNGWEKSDSGARAWAVKDAGDDIDITDGAVIRGSLREISSEEVMPEDYCESCGSATLVIRAGDGVGLVTRPGLDVPVGKWAINPVPRRMIAENLLRAGLGRRSGTWLAEVGVDKGETLARKTLNPTLGIEGGLSILGTSGIVVPCSNAAYIKTIEVLLKGARAADCSTAVLVTGGRSLRAARAEYPELPDVSFVRIGDFIREACDYACRAGLSELIVCCMPGKLAKYAMGYEYTHAHKVAQSPSAVAGLLAEDGVPDEILSALRTSRSIREGLSRMTCENVNVTIANLASHADAAISNWAPGMELSVRVLSFDGMEWWL